MSSPRIHPFGRLVICAVGLLGISILVALLLHMAGQLAPVFMGHPLAEPLAETAARYALLLTVLLYPFMLGWIALCRRRFDHRSFASLGFHRRRAWADGARGALTGLLSIGLLWSILWLTGAISVSGLSPDLAGHLNDAILPLLGYAGVFIAVGFFEETLFRGYILHNLASWFGWRGAVTAQAALFALVHLGNVQGSSSESVRAALGAMPSLFLIAVFFALSTRKTGSLWFPIGFHFAWNFFLGPVLSLPVSGIDTFHLLDVRVNEVSWLSGGAFGAEGSWLLIPIIAAMVYYITKAPDHPQSLLDFAPLEAAPVATALPAPIEEEEEPEADRESRFSTKFGSAQGFSADTLNELRDLQEAREKVQREAAEAAKREALEVASLAAKPVAEPVAAVVAPVFASEATPTKVVETVKPVEVEEELVAAPVAGAPVAVVEKPVAVKPVETSSERPVVKKAAPRW